MVSIEKLPQERWTKYWIGNWSLLSSAYWAEYYTRHMEKQLGMGLHRVVLISKEGNTACHFHQEERKRFGLHRAQQVLQDSDSFHLFIDTLKQKADALVDRIDLSLKQEISKQEFYGFLAQFREYTGLHITPRNVIDFLPPEKVQDVLAPFTDVRLYVENVFKKTEEFMRHWAAQISGTGHSCDLILSMLPDEVETYFTSVTFPPLPVLEQRYTASALFCEDGEFELFVGEQVMKVEDALSKRDGDTMIQGTVAYKGKAQGVVRVIFDPAKANQFQEGNILVTGMTRPEFLPLMKKAVAFVTDSGGILCHAAIVAREMKKPCIIGTEVATKVLRDGDMVEVDATKGIVRKLS